ncbi:MAG: DUF2027 domain-containing protein [Coprobacter sp.]|nr:DUF2027 domain-containing protein [Coprobacter sp.]
MIKIGDKVRFLNAVGGGIVRRIDRDIVLVEEEDGFETPVLARECVVIESGRVQDTRAVPVDKKESPRRAPQVMPVIEPEDEPELPIVETTGGNKINLYLAFLPEEDRRLNQTAFDVYLINDSNYYLDYICMSRNNEGDGWAMIYRGTIEPNIQFYMETITHEDVTAFEHFSIQAVAYKRDKSYPYKEPISTILHIDPVKFYKLHTFGENDFFDENAWVVPVVENDLPTRPLRIDAQSLAEAMRQKADDRPRKKVVSHKQVQTGPLEIDLHIHQLVDTTAGMSNSDMLQLQLQTFRDTLDAHRKEKGRKIVFIHGKGDGVLRRAILDELQRRYKNYDYQDASFREYGFGATQVTIR